MVAGFCDVKPESKARRVELSAASFQHGLKSQLAVKVTVPFAYSIMHRSHPVEKSKLEKEFVDELLGQKNCKTLSKPAECQKQPWNC